MGALTGRVAVIAGGASGIGEAVVHRLSSMGAAVAVLGRGSAHSPEAVADSVRRAGGRASAFTVDVRDHELVGRAVQDCADEFGSVDILVTSAAVTLAALSPGASGVVNVADMSQAQWREVIDINLTGVFNCCQAVLGPMLNQQYGRIVAITSRGGFVPPAGVSAYAASKAGITALTKSLAKEVARQGITVNCVAPGLVRTPLAVLDRRAEDILEREARTREGIGVLLEADDVAGSVAFLCTEDARYITGQTIHVNAGAYMP